MVKERNKYTIFMGRPKGKRSLGRSRHKWEIILKWILKKRDARDWTGLMWLRIGACGVLL
jgi:hypothetical protein